MENLTIRARGGEYIVRTSTAAYLASRVQVYNLLMRFYRERYPIGNTAPRKYARFLTLKVEGALNGFRRSAVVTVK